jgi:hypothetical protein
VAEDAKGEAEASGMNTTGKFALMNATILATATKLYFIDHDSVALLATTVVLVGGMLNGLVYWKIKKMAKRNPAVSITTETLKK